MTYIYKIFCKIFKNLSPPLLISLLTLSYVYAGNTVIVTRGDSATISWSVANGSCRGFTSYPNNVTDSISSSWQSAASYSGVGSSNFGGQKVTAVAGTYTFDCIVPAAASPSCDGTKSGVQGACWDTATLTVGDCANGYIWDTNAWSATYLTCAMQICTPDRVLVTTGCVQPTIGTMTHTCNSTGLGYVESSCALTSCPTGYTVIGSACQPDSCTNGAINPLSCDQCSTGQAWDTVNSKCISCNGTCSGGAGSKNNPNGLPSNPLICNNGGTNPPTCNICTASKNFISNVCVTPGVTADGAITAADCQIGLRGNSCTTVISFNTINTSSVRVENCTSNTVIAPNMGGGARTLPASTILYGTTCLRLIDNNTNITLSNTTVNATCNAAQSLTWHNSKCMSSVSCGGNGCGNPAACNAGTGMNYFPDVDKCIAPLGTFNSNTHTCTIATGSNSCHMVVSWGPMTGVKGVSLTDSSGDPNGLYIRVDGGAAYTYASGVQSNHRDSGVDVYSIYDRDTAGQGTGILLDTTTVSAVCAATDAWDGTKCVRKNCVPLYVDQSGCPQGVANGAVTRTCDALGINYGSCTLTSCAAKYTMVGSACQPNACTNGCTNAPGCNNKSNTNFFATPLPDGVCKAPAGNFTNNPTCEIQIGQSGCNVPLSWTSSDTVAVTLEDTITANGYGTNWGAGPHVYVTNGGVTIPYNGGDYRIRDVTTSGSSVVLGTIHLTPTLPLGTEWNGSVVRPKVTLSTAPLSRYYGEPYTLTWTSNAAGTDISYGASSIANNIVINSYAITGLAGQPSLTDASQVLTYNLIAHTTGLSSVVGSVNVNLAYRAVASFGIPSMVDGIVTLPLTCKYSTAYTIKNAANATLASISGLDKTGVTSTSYTCPISSCDNALTLRCISDTDDTAITTLSLADLAAKVNTFSILPSTVQNGSLNNTIAINWSLNTHDHCYVRVNVDPESYINMTAEQMLQYKPVLISEVNSIKDKIKATGGLYPVNVNKSKDVTTGVNVITGVKATYSKIFSMVCGDTNGDGVPDGIYANMPSAIKNIKLRVSTVREQ